MGRYEVELGVLWGTGGEIKVCAGRSACTHFTKNNFYFLLANILPILQPVHILSFLAQDLPVSGPALLL